MDGHATYMLGHAKNDDFPIDFANFTKALRTNGPTNQWANQPMDQPTIQPTNGPTNLRNLGGLEYMIKVYPRFCKLEKWTSLLLE